MLGFPKETKNESKCYVTHGQLGHVDPKQPPLKRKPFAAILNHDFLHRAELILPEELYNIIKADFFNALTEAAYSKVTLPLRAFLEGDFFTEYIKKGNILMLSEGRRGVDKLYSLRNGILTLHLDRESYERAGLVGKPDGAKGKRGTRPRWVVEINLRQPSMLHGKKGFDKIVYAFKNVLTEPVTWLFCDLVATSLSPDPLDAHFPLRQSISPAITPHIKVNVPPLKPPVDANSGYGKDFEDFIVETHEWLSLISLDSPRINADDKIDSFLSRYVSPAETTTSSNLVRIKWSGFLSPSWAHNMFMQVLLAVPPEAWFVCSMGGFGEAWPGGSKDCTILRVPDSPKEYILWEVSQ